MAIGLLGNPLVKGHGEVILTCAMAVPVTGAPFAGKLCVLIDSSSVSETTVAPCTAANIVSNPLQGVMTHDLFISRQDKAEGVVSVVERGSKIPVQVDGDIDVSGDVGVTADGKVCAAASADSKGTLDAKIVASSKFTALDENGLEVECVLIDLYSPAFAPKSPVKAVKEKA